MDTSYLIVKKGRHGLGLFTTKPIKKGTRIIEYTGEKITTEEADRRGGQYLFRLNKKWTLDGKGREHTARYINHSCSGNCYAELTNDERHVYIIAKRNIASGEELAYNYGKEFWRAHIEPKGCRCEKCLKAKADQKTT